MICEGWYMSKGIDKILNSFEPAPNIKFSNGRPKVKDLWVALNIAATVSSLEKLQYEDSDNLYIVKSRKDCMATMHNAVKNTVPLLISMSLLNISQNAEYMISSRVQLLIIVTGNFEMSKRFVFRINTRATCPPINGNTTVRQILKIIPLPAVDETFSIINNIKGVEKMPIKLPRTLAHIARGVDPPAARVNITAEDTGGGRAATT